ncbi:MAG: hypothetical protein ACC652_08545 [Acidimicrobiales bacterium]
MDALDAARALPEVKAAESIIDTSAAAHFEGEHLLYRSAGIDQQLADAMYGLLGQPSFHPPYPDVAGVLQALKHNGVKICVVYLPYHLSSTESDLYRVQPMLPCSTPADGNSGKRVAVFTASSV